MEHMEPVTIDHEGYMITTDKSLMNLHDIHKWLSEVSYWNKNVKFETVRTAFDHSFCVGILHRGHQVGYARLITDYAIFAYLADVYILEEHRGKGLAKAMLQVLLGFEWVKGLRGIKLATTDAHELYRQFGFGACAHPERIMEISRSPWP